MRTPIVVTSFKKKNVSSGKKDAVVGSFSTTLTIQHLNIERNNKKKK